MTITILSLNARGLNHPAKSASLWKSASDHKCDIFCVQQTHFAQHTQPLCHNRKFIYTFKVCCMQKKHGLLIAIEDSVSFQLQQSICDENSRYIILICNINNTHYTIVNIYSPNQRQICVLTTTIKKAKNVQKGHLLICGDFNMIPDNRMDSTSGSKHLESPFHKLI